MQDRVIAHVTSVDIEEAKNGTCRLMAKYFFEFHGKTYQGTSTVVPVCQNPWAAQHEAELLQGVDRKAWVNPKIPSHSALYNPFPVAALLSSGCCIGVLIYSLFRYVFWRRQLD